MHRYLPALILLFVSSPTLHAQVVFTVDSNLDQPDAAPGDGQCRSAGNVCTLRAALHEVHETANATGDFEVRLPPGVYALAHVIGDAPVNYAAGDLDFQPPPGAASVTLAGWDGNGALPANERPVITAAPGFKRRLMDAVVNGGQTLRLRDLVFADARPAEWNAQGLVDNGAAVQCASQQGGELEIERVRFSGNEVRAVGAAIFSTGCRLAVTDSEFVDNCGLAGALVSSYQTQPVPRTLRMSRVSFTGNDPACLDLPGAQFWPVAIRGDLPAEAWDIALADVTIGASTGAMAIAAPAGAPSALRTVSLRNVTLHANAPDFLGHDGVYVSGDVTLRAGHSTLGVLSRASANARVQSSGHLRAEFALDTGATLATQPSDLASSASAVALGPLRTTGAYTQGFMPLAGSPLIDAGALLADDAVESACTSADQSGTPRPWGAACDVGAIEFVSLRVFADGFE
jgi:hypothetical protein